MHNSTGEDPIRVSVVIPTYNYAHFLQRAIESVLAQSLPVHELIVADDGSTDDTAAVVGRYPNVTYHVFPHRGVYALRAAILPAIEGDWYLNLDADNWLNPDFIARMVSALNGGTVNDTSLAFLYPDMVMHGDATGLNSRPEFDAQLLTRGNYLDMNSLIRTDVAQRYGFDPAFNSGQGDYDFFLTLVKNGYHGLRVPEALLHYHAHGDSLSRTASRRRQQRRIMKRIVRKHRDFFSAEERKIALACAANRLLVALINGRSPYAGPWSRMRDLFAFLGVGLRHAELGNQFAYTLRPRRFHSATIREGGAYFLFRDTPQRRSLLRQVHESRTPVGGREQLFGYDVLVQKGVPVDHNLGAERIASWADIYQAERERRYVARTGIGLGDERSVAVHLPQMNRSCCVLSTTDTVGLPALRARFAGRLKVPVIYVSIGLPERIQSLRLKAPSLESEYRKWFLKAEHIVAYGYAESRWLKEWLGNLVPVTFIPFGVDTEFWHPEDVEESVDCLCVGADQMRDFNSYVALAHACPELKMKLVCSRTNLAGINDSLPANLEIKCDIPLEEVRQAMLTTKLVVLPVCENTYSGATTTLLQAMSLGKAVVISRVGAIRSGYGLVDGGNVCLFAPGDMGQMQAAVKTLLAQESERLQIGQSARMHVVDHLNWKRYACHLAGLLTHHVHTYDSCVTCRNG